MTKPELHPGFVDVLTALCEAEARFLLVGADAADCPAAPLAWSA